MELKKGINKKIWKAHQELEEFVYYVDSFYNIHSGIYPIASRETIQEAISIYLLLAKTENIEVEFDSIDREQVRRIIEEIKTDIEELD
mgnify:CR=1 FL=1|tara:strand:- start:41 stop:304 length:264 start_codon:yes stop_codon:yes gene_type:complete